MTPGRRRRRDDGTVLLLVLGLVVVALGLVAVVVDASRLFLARRSLASLADGAALAGAQAVDRPAVYAHGLAEGVPLDPQAAAAAVTDYLAASRPGPPLTGVQVTAVSTAISTGGTGVTGVTGVTVRLAATVRLPFTGTLLGSPQGLVVDATSRAAPVLVAP